MSSVYITEPATSGKVVLHTSYGDVDIELWPKEAPRAVRNFVQLCMEGFYNDIVFHRVIKGLFIQTGDPTGTGRGGESIYGGNFMDEFHSRLRFNHRGQVAMANLNVANTNTSQFFITLDKCSWLDKKHTIFGKVTGNTLFNVLRMGDIEVDKDDRPMEPPRLLSVEVVDNPFPDIVPRVGMRSKSAEETLRDAASARQALKAKVEKTSSRMLSFVDDEGEESLPARPIKILSAHALLRGEDPSLVDAPAEALREFASAVQKRSRSPSNIKQQETGLVPAAGQLAKRARTEQVGHDLHATGGALASDDSSELARLTEQLRNSRRAPALLREDFTDAGKQVPAQQTLTPLEQMRAKYVSRGRVPANREKTTLEKLQTFQSVLRSSVAVMTEAAGTPEASEHYRGQVLEEAEVPEKGQGDMSWMTTKLKFKRHVDDAYRGLDHGTHAAADDGLMTVDPFAGSAGAGARRK